MSKHNAGSSSAPTSPTLRDTMAAEDKNGFDFPSPSTKPVAPGGPEVLVTHSNGEAVGASASNPDLPGSVSDPITSEDSGIKHTDFAPTAASSSHHHHHHSHNHRHGAHAREAPVWSLGGAHAYPPGSVYNQYHPPGTRRSGQRQVQGLGRPMPTWQELQLAKQLKAERAARDGHGHKHHHHKSGGHTDDPLNASMTSLALQGKDIQHAIAEVQRAMYHLTTVLPEGYAGTMTPYTLTPAVSRVGTRTAEHSVNGDALMVDGTEKGFGSSKDNDLKPTASHDSSYSSDSDDEEEEERPNPIARFRHWIREPAAEFWGTFMLITFGNGVNNQFFLSFDPAVSTVVRGTYTSVSWCWGIGVMTGVYVSGGISGGHINPVVTISLAVFRQFPWRKVLPFIVAQLLGAMTASAFQSLLYAEAVDIYEGAAGRRTTLGPNSTANLYTTFPLEYVSIATGFFQEFFDTAILMMVILAIGDSNNTPPPDGLNPVILMFLIFGIGAALGSQTAYAINPARDLGPRLMLYMRGYGSALWTFEGWYWLHTPIAATIVGGLVGCLVYDLFIYTGAESPLNQKWEWRWSKKHKGFVDQGPYPGTENQTNEKMPAGGEHNIDRTPV